MAQAHTGPLETSNVAAPTVLPSKLSPGIANGRPDKSRTKGVVRNAANTEAVEDPPLMPSLGGSSKNILLPASSKESTLRTSMSTPAVEPPPTVVAGTPENSDKLANIVSAPTLLPGLGVRISQGVTQANIIRQIAPVYPQQALSMRLEGSVTLDASVAEDGTVREVKVLRGQPILAAAAVAAVQQWRYSPSLLNGKPTPAQRKITVTFKLR
jgi:TonB family protein